MVSFSCEACGDVLTKKKLDPHRNRCSGATFTCIDCMVYFPGVQYRSHTSCMTEDQKYQGALYKDKSKKQNQSQRNNNHQHARNNQFSNSHQNNTKERDDKDDAMVQHAYVEDCYDDREYDWNDYAGPTEDEKSPAEPPPEAPTPPPAAQDRHVDVFEFLVPPGETPNPSTLNLCQDTKEIEANENNSLVRYEFKNDDYLDSTPFMNDAKPLVEYGTGPVPTAEFVTPAPKHERRKRGGSVEKKDKKRKHLHVDVPSDQDMIDAPPVLHSGLTGGLKSMMRPMYPPSPDYSGNDLPEASPASPLKKTKHSKHAKHHSQVSNSIFGMLTAPPKTKAKTKSKSKKSKSSKKSSHRHKEDKAPKLIEYRPHSKDGTDHAGGSEMILFKPRADVFLSFINKGPESERGCSMNKALKRFHRERQETGSNMGKIAEEKELWKSLRLRRNERGEIVLFTI